MIETQIVELDIDDLIKADWNYKTDGTSEQIEKFVRSIEHDKSAGVPAVREIDGKFEVIDGNHRLDALLKLGWKKVPCENFGEISKAQAIIIARRRNHKWFEDDVLKLAELFRDDVIPEFDLDKLAEFMPETREEMEDWVKLLDYDWDSLGSRETDDVDDDIKYEIRINVEKEVFDKWNEIKDDRTDLEFLMDILNGYKNKQE